ncbi:arginase family protein [Kibdelosporangium persicum]|uniref:Arginase n=1 Tax=Kibdelosporangium persicum TaxID=2698649 RepID=A0ABX2F1G6_9PSEU|nr:arginase family protein [Kibdelosporangium persicum]NRN65156.1 Arginase [Kibdelosporangium persicum]
MKPLRVIMSPFHDGREGVDRGRGPARLVQAASAQLAAVQTVTVPAVDPSLPEAARVFELARRLKEHVRAALAEGVFPLVVAGDCNSSLGTSAGCGTDDLGVVWFDAHPDFDTPERSHSGSLDAMGLAVLTGDGWSSLRDRVLGLRPVSPGNVLQISVRDYEPGQREDLLRSPIHVLEGNTFSDARLRAELDGLRGRVNRVYLHIDLDCLDPSEGVANQYSAEGGLSLVRLLGIVGDIFERFDVVAAAVTAYHPESDIDGRMAITGSRVLTEIAQLVN